MSLGIFPGRLLGARAAMVSFLGAPERGDGFGGLFNGWLGCFDL